MAKLRLYLPSLSTRPGPGWWAWPWLAKTISHPVPTHGHSSIQCEEEWEPGTKEATMQDLLRACSQMGWLRASPGRQAMLGNASTAPLGEAGDLCIRSHAGPLPGLSLGESGSPRNHPPTTAWLHTRSKKWVDISETPRGSPNKQDQLEFGIELRVVKNERGFSSLQSSPSVVCLWLAY